MTTAAKSPAARRAAKLAALNRASAQKGKHLDLNAAPGTYTLDRCGCDYYGVPFDPQHLFLLRWEVDKSARLAALRAGAEWETVPNARETAARVFAALEMIERAAKPFERGGEVDSLVELMPAFQPKPGGDHLSPAPHLMQIIEGTRHLSEWCKDFRKNFQAISAPPPNSEPLVRAFVERMIHYHVARKDALPPNNRGGGFSLLLSAAWSDVAFPVPTAADLVGYFGQAVERAVSRSCG